MASEIDNGQDADLTELLERRRARLKRELDAVEQLLGCISYTAGDVTASAPETASDSTDYASLKPQEAVLRLLRDYPGKRFRPSALTKKLKKLGVKSKSRTFSSVVAAAAKRLADQGIAVRELEGKRPVYSCKPEESGADPATNRFA